jgi:ABC-type cobalamin/Fe3+-siderophores transport system ATPase subunit
LIGGGTFLIAIIFAITYKMAIRIFQKNEYKDWFMKVKIANSALILAGIEYDFSSDITILLGPNGSGKSTLLKAILLKQLDIWELNSDYKLPSNQVTVENMPSDIGYYFVENNNKTKMSHMSDDIMSHLKDIRSSSGEATFAQVLRSFGHQLILLDEPDQSLDICNSIILKEVIPKLVIKDKSKIIMTVHSAYLLKSLGSMNGVKIIDVTTGQETTAENYLSEQFKKAMNIVCGNRATK